MPAGRADHRPVRPTISRRLTQNLLGLATVSFERFVACLSFLLHARSDANRFSGVTFMGNGMASEATWQTGGAYRTGEASTDSPMDQRTVESLLRRLVERVEESERRYSEALDELHARLDQLSQTTEAVRATTTPEDSATLDRLHDQMNSLARRFEPQSTNPLDDFERLGKELSANLDFAAGGSDGLSGAADVPSAFPSAPTPLRPQETLSLGLPDFGFKAPDFPFSSSSFDLPPFTSEGAFDKRLTDVAHQLEHSLGTVMPAATIEALNTRLDEIASQLSEALRQAPKLDNLASVEKQLSEMGQQLSRAEAQLSRMNGIEDQLRTLIERFDAAPDVLEEIASKAASEAARLVAENTQSGASEERIDAMHRDLVAMSDKSRASDERLAGTLQAVHESLKQLVQQVEKSAAAALQPPKPQAPFAERVRAGARARSPPVNALPLPAANGSASLICRGAHRERRSREWRSRGHGRGRKREIAEEPACRFARRPQGQRAYPSVRAWQARASGGGSGRSRRCGPTPSTRWFRDRCRLRPGRPRGGSAPRGPGRGPQGRGEDGRRTGETLLCHDCPRQHSRSRCVVETQALSAHDQRSGPARNQRRSPLRASPLQARGRDDAPGCRGERPQPGWRRPDHASSRGLTARHGGSRRFAKRSSPRRA